MASVGEIRFMRARVTDVITETGVARRVPYFKCLPYAVC